MSQTKAVKKPEESTGKAAKPGRVELQSTSKALSATNTSNTSNTTNRLSSTKKNSNTNKSESIKAKPVTSVSDKTRTKSKDNKTNVTTTTSKTNNSSISDAKKSVAKQTKPTPSVVNRNVKVVKVQNKSDIKTSVSNNKSIVSKESDVIKNKNKITRSGAIADKKSVTSKTKPSLVTIETKDSNQLQVEEYAAKDSSDEQYASLATLESLSSYRQSHKSSEVWHK